MELNNETKLQLTELIIKEKLYWHLYMDGEIVSHDQYRTISAKLNGYRQALTDMDVEYDQMQEIINRYTVVENKQD